MPGTSSPRRSQGERFSGQSAPATRSLVWALDTDLKGPRPVRGAADVMFISGWCYHPDQPIRRLYAVLGDLVHPVSQHGLTRPEVLQDQVRQGLDATGNSLFSGFWVAAAVPPIQQRCRLPLSLRARLKDGREVTAPVCELDLGPPTPRPNLGAQGPAQAQGPLVAICMATYNPPIDLLGQQMDSLLAQTHRNWVCLVSDDGSAASVFAEIERVAARDPRFLVERNAKRLGYYRNFERCLNRVPAEARYVAFCDQDDLWYPEKLTATLAAFRDDVTLAYCDMHIVDREGRRLAETYWTARRNNYTDLAALVFANTVTGAASVFRAELLDLVLPFPEPVGEAFHDHWVACAALASGRIVFLDRSLYAYRQHGGNVIGHYAGEESRPLVPSILGWLGPPATLKHRLRAHLRLVQHGYRVLTKVVLIARTLEERLSTAAAGPKRTVLARLARMERSAWPLAGEALRALVHRRPTLGLEAFCLRGAVGTRVAGTYHRLRQKGIYAQARANIRLAAVSEGGHSAAASGVSDAESLLQKTAALKLSVSAKAAVRVNVIVSTVDFRYLFAGYFSMFNLALRLAREGERARLVVVDQCDYDPAAWRERIVDYPGLERLFDSVETAYCFDRSVPLEVSRKDAFLATSWWTAHVAHKAARELGQRPFTFLAQEFEPLFYPAGSLYAMALEAYGFPHYAIFSTDVLREYFRQSRLGVFRDDPTQGERDSVTIENAVPVFQVDAARLCRASRRRFLFYSRPEAHAARNMFEMGLLALRLALGDGQLDPGAWEFDGMGGAGGPDTIDLGRGAGMNLLPRTSLRKYVGLLPSYDLGLSLMLSPHPSMTPLDMAAAGLVTVTNTFATKTAERLAAISPNIVPVEPTIEAIAAGIGEAARRVGDIEGRLAGARLNWSTSWETTFNAEVMDRIRRFVAVDSR